MGNIHTAAHFKTMKMNKLQLHATKITVTHISLSQGKQE